MAPGQAARTAGRKRKAAGAGRGLGLPPANLGPRLQDSPHGKGTRAREPELSVRKNESCRELWGPPSSASQPPDTHSWPRHTAVAAPLCRQTLKQGWWPPVSWRLGRGHGQGQTERTPVPMRASLPESTTSSAESSCPQPCGPHGCCCFTQASSAQASVLADHSQRPAHRTVALTVSLSQGPAEGSSCSWGPQCAPRYLWAPHTSPGLFRPRAVPPHKHALGSPN